jgi:hypothetical protein
MTDEWLAPPATTLGLIPFAVTILSVWTSSWRRGEVYFRLLIISLTSSFALFAMDGIAQGEDALKVVGVSAMLYGVFLYMLSLKYITNTAFLETSPASHDDLRAWLKQRGNVSSYERFVLVLGPTMFALMIVLALFLAWEKFIA